MLDFSVFVFSVLGCDYVISADRTNSGVARVEDVSFESWEQELSNGTEIVVIG